MAAQIRAERAASGMTQAEAFTKAGMSRSTYLRLEAGTRVPDIEDLAKIAALYRLKFLTLMERIEERAEQISQIADH